MRPLYLCFFEIRFKLKKTKEGYIQLKENYRDILSDIEIKEAFKDDELLRNTESSTRRSTIIWSVAWGILLVAAIIIIEVFTANHGLFVWLWNKVF